MVYTSVLVAAFAALAAAIPQQAEHISNAQISRLNQVLGRDVNDLASRGVSQDGSCGTASGLTCREGDCCSALGWCGATPLHCGTGCQSGFGKCGTDGTTPAAAPVVAPVVAPASAPQQDEKPASTQPVVNTPAAIEPAVPAVVPQAASNTNQQQSNNGQSQSSGQSQQSAPQSSGLGNTYKQYSGDGSTAAGWPSQSSWVDFETAFADNKATMQSSCSKWTPGKDTTDAEVQEIHDAILAVSSSSGVDSRFILAIVMQESGGCPRAPTTVGYVRNPGLMQSFNGKGSCNDGGVQYPCPSSEITQMLNDGVKGTIEGSTSLVSALAQVPGSDASRYYKAARIYNSGSIAGPLEGGVATHCYSSDIANRLTGWSSSSGTPCTFDH